ncbi:hypothetical protein C8R43DRAFT_11888 [Mycena crocata]|nr:hypothetical protein C8R43DRAFT_11888 [Mycena crocata]
MPSAVLSIAVFTQNRIQSLTYDTNNSAPRPTRPRGAVVTGAGANAPNKRRRRGPDASGYLAAALDVPLEILAEIFSWLSPLDLLTLARTSKPLRAYFMNQRNAFLWRASRALVGLPRCPPDLSEPQYAYLAFVPLCHGVNCNKTCHLVVWQFRARYCNACFDTLTAAPKSLIDEMRRLEVSFPEDDADLFPSVFSRKQHRSEEKLFRRRELQGFFDELSMMSADAIEALVRTRRTSTAAIEEHAQMCVDWQAGNISTRRCALYKIYKGRQDAIRGRLEGLGWGEDIQTLGWDKIKDGHKALRESKELTNRIWNNISSSMVQYIKDCIWEKLNTEHYLARRKVGLAVWAQYRDTRLALEPSAILPPALDAVFHPLFLAVIEAPPGTALVDASSFDALIPRFGEITADWRAGAESRLAATLQVPVAMLRLARTVATCRVCGCSMAYPTILAHPCFTRFFAPRDLRAEERKYASTYVLAGSRLWTCEGFVHASEKGGVLQDLLRVCGVPENVSAVEMDARSLVVSCDGCLQRVAMDWRTAVSKHDKVW